MSKTPVVITPGQSITEGILASAGLGAIPSFLLGGLASFAFPPLAIPVLVLGLAGSAGYGLNAGMNINIPVGYRAVRTKNGTMLSNEVWESGEHFGIWGQDGGVLYDARKRRLDIATFKELAQNGTDIFTEMYLIVQVVDGYVWLNTGDADGSLRKLVQSKLRIFTNQLSDSTLASSLKDVVAEFLNVRPDYPDAIYDLWMKLQPYMEPIKDGPKKGKRHFTFDGICTILSAAGDFVEEAELMGFDVDEVHVEEFDITDELRKAAQQVPIAVYEMDAARVRFDARVQMAEQAKSRLGITDGSDAMREVNLGLKLATQNIDTDEIRIYGLSDVLDKFGAPVANAVHHAANAIAGVVTRKQS